MPQATETDTHRAVLRVPAVAKYLDVSESLIWKQLREQGGLLGGKLKPLPGLGDRILFSKAQLDRLLCEE